MMKFMRNKKFRFNNLTNVSISVALGSVVIGYQTYNYENNDKKEKFNVSSMINIQTIKSIGNRFIPHTYDTYIINNESPPPSTASSIHPQNVLRSTPECPKASQSAPEEPISPITRTKFYSELTQILSSSQISIDDDDCEANSKPWSSYHTTTVIPQYVLYPETVQDVSMIAKLCYKYQIQVCMCVCMYVYVCV